MATFNWPASLAPQTTSWGLQKAGAQFRSPFAGSVESVAFPGEFWKVGVQLPARKMREGGEGEAFFARLAGGVDRVLVPYWPRLVPRGTLRGTPTLGSAAAQGDLQLVLTVASGATLLAGDRIGVGGQLFAVFQDCTAVGTALTVPLVNRVRTAIASGSVVTWNAPTVLCCMPAMSAERAYEPAVAQALPADFEEVPA